MILQAAKEVFVKNGRGGIVGIVSQNARGVIGVTTTLTDRLGLLRFSYFPNTIDICTAKESMHRNT
jgi:hypothetical protein